MYAIIGKGRTDGFRRKSLNYSSKPIGCGCRRRKSFCALDEGMSGFLLKSDRISFSARMLLSFGAFGAGPVDDGPGAVDCKTVVAVEMIFHIIKETAINANGLVT